MNSPHLRVTPIGGLGQIGSNMILVESSDQKIIIDAGILFPYENFFDINYLIPDFYEIENPTDLIITHGHEDHIGATAHVIRQFPHIKIHAPSLSKALILRKLEYLKITFPINEYRNETVFDFKDFKIHPIHVNHSIPETFGLLFIQEENALFYVSDFKIDFNSPYEKPFDFEKLKNLSSGKKRKVLMADSTNITSKRLKTPSESDLIPEFESLLSMNYERFFITTFSSNIHRIQTIINLAIKFKRKIVPYGLSLQSYSEIASRLGILKDWESVSVSPKSIKGDEKNLIVLLAGCQGDFKSSLRRVASGEDKKFLPQKGDLFIFSSKAIPGNEKRIGLIINDLYRQKADVITEADNLVHVSGHPGRDDLKRLYQEFNPDILIPIHGEISFLIKHQKFFNDLYPKKKSFKLFNHESLLINEKIEVKKDLSKPPIIIHGNGIELERPSISERRKMACNGVVFISFRSKSKIHITYQGIPQSFSQKDKDHLENLISRKLHSQEKNLSEEIRIESRRFINTKLGYKPIVIAHQLVP